MSSSVHSASPSPLQAPANSPADGTQMPKGNCRYILLLPEVKGQRCACVSFSLNKDIPGATCDCGHLACFHSKAPEVPSDQKLELELLKKRMQRLEDQLSNGQEDVLDSVVNRLHEVEEHLEKSKEEVGEQIKGAYRNVSISWRSLEQEERKNQEQDAHLHRLYGKLRDHDEQLERLHAGQLELRNVDVSLEVRIENLRETLEKGEEAEESRLSAAAATRPPRRRWASDSPRPNMPADPLGLGVALADTNQRAHPSPTGGRSTQGQGHGNGRDDSGGQAAAQGAARCLPASAPSTGAWTVHVSLLPHAFVPMPFERNTNAYQRCLSRGLHQMVVVHGSDAASFRAAVEKAFRQFLRGREWMPLQAKLCDAETLQGLPMLRQLNPLPVDASFYDHDFLRKHCAVCDSNGMIDSLYIAMRRHTISWHTLRHSPVFIDGLEDCWAYDVLLDTDPFDGDMAVDDEDRPAAGNITTALPLQAGLKRPLPQMSRSNSIGAGSAPGPEADEGRAKRMCPAPPQAAIVETRRRSTKY